MIKKTILLLFTIILPGKLFSQTDYNFSGYIVNQPIYTINNSNLSEIFSIKKDQFIDVTRIRLRPELFLWQGARITLEYEIDALYSPENIHTLFDMENTSRQIINLRWEPVNEQKINITHFVDRLYFRQGFSWGNVIAGRQRISWGTGRIWNPTDLFNPINPANFSKIEKDGADAVSLTYIFGSFTDLNIVYNPQSKLNSSNAAFRFRTNFWEYDMSVIGGYFDKRIITGLDFAGNLFDAGIRGEGIISMDKNNLNNNFVRFILGADNQFTSKLYALIEYQFNGEGRTDKMKYDLLKLLKGEIINLNRNYIFVSASYLLTPLLNTSLSFNSNINDGSGFVGLTASYSLSENITLNSGMQIPFGKTFSEYWYYPTSFYLQGEFYF